MYTAISILTLTFIIVLWRFKVIYDRKLKKMQIEWLEYVTTAMGELESKLAMAELEKEKDGQ